MLYFREEINFTLHYIKDGKRILVFIIELTKKTPPHKLKIKVLIMPLFSILFTFIPIIILKTHLGLFSFII